MKYFSLIVNREKPGAEEAAAQIEAFLKAEDSAVRTEVLTDPKDVPSEQTECIITVGGDGTMIQAARSTLGRCIPMIGMNRGHTGFLTELGDEDVEGGLKRLLEGDFELEDRMMLDASVYRGGELLYHDVALNEAVLIRYEHQGAASFRVYVNDTFLAAYHADGIIAATPTGSTAYSFSAGGPIAAPASRLILLTAICPHSISSRSVILSENDEVRLVPGPESQRFSCDGAEPVTLMPGDEIRIRRSENICRFIRLGDMSFVERLGARINYT